MRKYKVLLLLLHFIGPSLLVKASSSKSLLLCEMSDLADNYVAAHKEGKIDINEVLSDGSGKSLFAQMIEVGGLLSTLKLLVGGAQLEVDHVITPEGEKLTAFDYVNSLKGGGARYLVLSQLFKSVSANEISSHLSLETLLEDGLAKHNEAVTLYYQLQETLLVKERLREEARAIAIKVEEVYKSGDDELLENIEKVEEELTGRILALSEKESFYRKSLEEKPFLNAKDFTEVQRALIKLREVRLGRVVSVSQPQPTFPRLLHVSSRKPEATKDRRIPVRRKPSEATKLPRFVTVSKKGNRH